jgi:hypothetical protein
MELILLPTAVLRDCEICGKFTFIFRKKFYLSRKISVPNFATSQSRETLAEILEKNRKTRTNNGRKFKNLRKKY